MNAANTVFLLVCTMLVMFMVPGLSMFYGGLVRYKNVLSTIMHSFALLAIVSILWAFFGYSLAFSPGNYFVIGGFDYLFLNNVGYEVVPNGKGIPEILYMGFQMMFAVLTPAIISGAFAERMRFKAMFIFSAIWLIIVYCPMAHWVWGGGWMEEIGALDFAGGAVVHMSSAAAALAAAQILGPRKKDLRSSFAPHNLTLTVAGCAILWFGWFGFNAGSALAADGIAANALVVTHLAAAAGALSWMMAEWVLSKAKKPTLLGTLSGSVAGLVSITPGAGFVGPIAAIIIGLIGGIVCFYGIMLKRYFHFDDALDAVGLHGIGGSWGALATGIFASSSIGGVQGSFYQFIIQLITVIFTWVFCYILSYILLKIIQKFTPLRVSEENELTGLDITEHGETAYQYGH